MSSILLRDPWSINNPGEWVKNHDTGWGNRLIAWDFVSCIIKTLGSKHKIKISPNEFPEIKTVHFPNTSVLKGGVNLLGSVAPPIYKAISNEDIINWGETGNLDLNPNFNYTTHYDFPTIAKYSIPLLENSFVNSYIKGIKLKNKKLSNALRDYSKNLIGLHLRRGHGVHYSPTDWELIPDHVKHLYDPCFVCDKHYRIVNDTRVFEIIEYFLQDPTHKIYISIDIDEKAIDYYKKKYPNRILTCNDFIQNHQDIIKQSNILKPIGDLTSIGFNLIDFFILAGSKFILSSKNSTWSKLAIDIYDHPHSILHNHLDDIIKDYNEFYIC